MTYVLFLDDERKPEFVPALSKMGKPILVATTYAGAIQIIESHGMPAYISFDHDLGLDENGVEKNGYDFAKWLCEQALDGRFSLKNLDYGVHSMNPVGARNIRCYLDSFMRSVYGIDKDN